MRFFDVILLSDVILSIGPKISDADPYIVVVARPTKLRECEDSIYYNGGTLFIVLLIAIFLETDFLCISIRDVLLTY